MEEKREMESSWKHKAEYYEKAYQKLSKELLKIKRTIEKLNLEAPH